MQCRCPKCQGIFEAETEWCGRQVECPFCHQAVPVQPLVNPQMQTPPSPPPVINPQVMVKQPSVAGIGVRFVAVFIDGILLGVGGMIVSFIIGLLLGVVGGILGMDSELVVLLANLTAWFVNSIIGIAYETLFIAMKGATPARW